MQKNLDAKHDKILKSLLRFPDNRRCAVCDSLVRWRDSRKYMYLPKLVCKLRKHAMSKSFLAGTSICCRGLLNICMHNLLRHPVSGQIDSPPFGSKRRLSIMQQHCTQKSSACDKHMIVCAVDNSITGVRESRWQLSSPKRLRRLRLVAMG